MSIFEYDEEKHMRSVHEEGRVEGENRVVQLMQKLIDAGRMEEMKRAISDREYREKLHREYDQ